MALKSVDRSEEVAVIFGAVVADTIGLIPFFGNIVTFVAYISLNLYFFINFGSRYLGGKRSGQKIANTIINGIVGATPIIGNIMPELTTQAIVMFRILDKEAKEDAEEATKKAANNNQPQVKLSRAA